LTDAVESKIDDQCDAAAARSENVKVPTAAESIVLLRWHLDRYDRLRASTASRASVVLSAGALLSAGNAVIISQLLSSRAEPIPSPVLGLCMAVALCSAAFVVLALHRASGVLVTMRSSRAMLDRDLTIPSGIPFNGTDTLGRMNSFSEFSALVSAQTEAEIMVAGHVELWIGINQHRYRYLRLRDAVRFLRFAAIVFFLALTTIMIVNLTYRT
jgi:hypothetical protein